MKNYSSIYLSEELKHFLSEITPPYNVVCFAKLGLEPEDDLLDPITNTIINFPVLLHNRSFDFDTLDMLEFNDNGMAKDPFTNILFNMGDVAPDYDLNKKIKARVLRANSEKTFPTKRVVIKDIEFSIKKAILFSPPHIKAASLRTLTQSIPIHELSELANQFQPEALYLYSLYFKGAFRVSKSDYKHVKYLKYALEQNVPSAQALYAEYCEFGKFGIKQDLTEAAKCYKLAANQGVITAKYNYGRCLVFGLGVAPEPEQAALHFKNAADLGLPAAQFNYGLCCAQGIGTKINLDEAKRYCKMANAQGFVPENQGHTIGGRRKF